MQPRGIGAPTSIQTVTRPVRSRTSTAGSSVSETLPPNATPSANSSP